jgi:hypothetical protein
MNAPVKELQRDVEPDVLARFTDDQWRELQVANMHFYEKLSSLGDVVSLAHLAVRENWPDDTSVSFEGFSLHVRDSLSSFLGSFEDIERLLADARKRGES